MALNKQIHIYSVDTSAFYKKRERKIHEKMAKLHSFKKKLEKLIDKIDDKILLEKRIRCLSIVNKSLDYYKKKLYRMLKANKNQRKLNERAINKKNIVSVFESTLTRTFKIPENSISEDIVIVKTFFFNVLEDIILNDFIYNDEKYVCFTASAGQIRTKKTVFIKESILKQYENSLMCGLTVEGINKHGGVNVNKYLAYLALCNSATDQWIGFDINKTIVVDDMETFVSGEVDFIDDKTYEITRKNMDIPICHTDGCGMMLPRVSKKSFMIRLPWVKGLLVPFPYDEYIKNINQNSEGITYGKVKDIYGKEWDLIDDNIEIIFTKSQFKMYKYYESWKHYKDNFIKYNCQAGICNLEDDDFSDVKIGYQMLQSLNEMTNDELKIISKQTKNSILRIGDDRKTILKIFGVTRSNKNKTYLQQAIELYPDIICDVYSKEVIKEIKKSLVKEGRAAKLALEGSYTFICPDLYAFCEYLITGNKNPSGLLKNNDVYCSLYNNSQKLDCLRSPHLFREHAIRVNTIDDIKKKWFVSKGLYTSCHDLISKILMFDNDGDKSLVCVNPTFVNSAERHMNNIVPLYYNMRKAEPEIITRQSLYHGLILAYTGGNIGMYSNDITKIWNSDDVNLDIIKLLCMENNFTIDYAKTLFKPTRPKSMKKEFSKYTNSKVPHFFIYAKNKKISQVQKTNKSVVNRLGKIIPNKRINFNMSDFEDFNYKLLMYDENIKLDESIINKYKELDRKTHYMIRSEEDEEYSNIAFTYFDIRNQILQVNPDIRYVVDVLIKYLYRIKNSRFKDTLWLSFGDVVVDNLKSNMTTKYIYCEKCGVLTKQINNRHMYCSSCWKEKQLQWKRETWIKNKDKYRPARVLENLSNTHE